MLSTRVDDFSVTSRACTDDASSLFARIQGLSRRQRRSAAATTTRASQDEDAAQDSSAYRAREQPELDGFFGKIVSNLPDGRKETAPESYGSRPESKTLKEGRYARGDPIRAGQVREDTIRGEDFEVVESGLPGVGTLVTLAVGGAVLFGVWKVVTLLGEEPVAPKRSSGRMPASDNPEVAALTVARAPVAVDASGAEAPAVEIGA